MEKSAREKSALTFRALHRSANGPLVLPNVWDAASARIVEAAGFPAIATTSAGIAYSLGYADGQHVPPAEMFAAVARIARVVRVPVSADLEAGYGDVAATTRALVDAGAVGLNLEDYEHGALIPLDEQLRRIELVRATGAALGVPVTINARTDIYLARLGDPATRFERSVERLRAFAAAGADSLFVPGVTDEPTIGALAAALNAPLNILGTAGTPGLARLRELGVARVSLGSGPMRASLGLMRRIAVELRDHGTWTAMLADTIPYDEVNALFGH